MGGYNRNLTVLRSVCGYSDHHFSACSCSLSTSLTASCRTILHVERRGQRRFPSQDMY